MAATMNSDANVRSGLPNDVKRMMERMLLLENFFAARSVPSRTPDGHPEGGILTRASERLIREIDRFTEVNMHRTICLDPEIFGPDHGIKVVIKVKETPKAPPKRVTVDSREIELTLCFNNDLTWKILCFGSGRGKKHGKTLDKFLKLIRRHHIAGTTAPEEKIWAFLGDCAQMFSDSAMAKAVLEEEVECTF